jgi:hypothetical protein
MFYFMMWAILWGVVGSFGTAYLHQRTGRDVQMGGLLGALVGAIGGIFLLVMLWIWLYYGNSGSTPVGRMYGRPRRVWYRWWD